MASESWAAAWKRAAKGNRELMRDRESDLTYEYTTRIAAEKRADELHEACQSLEWDAAEAGALAMAYEARITRALECLSQGDLSNARRALEGKPDA